MMQVTSACVTTWVAEGTAHGKGTGLQSRASLSSMCSVTHFFRNCFFFLRRAAASKIHSEFH